MTRKEKKILTRMIQAYKIEKKLLVDNEISKYKMSNILFGMKLEIITVYKMFNGSLKGFTKFYAEVAATLDK